MIAAGFVSDEQPDQSPAVQGSLALTGGAQSHTFGTQLAMAGRDARAVTEQMANSPDIVRRHYAAWLPSAHPEAAEFDTPERPVLMARPAVANLRVAARRRGLRVVRSE